MNDDDAYHGHDMYVMDMWKCTTLRQLEAGGIPLSGPSPGSQSPTNTPALGAGDPWL